MIPQSLTRSRTTLSDGRSAHIYHYEGRAVRIADSLLTALKLLRVFADELLTANDKANAAMMLLFDDPAKVADAFGDKTINLLAFALWEVCGIDMDGTRKAEYSGQSPVFDWEKDAERIKATLRGWYGLSWDDALHCLTYRDTCSLIGLAPHESPMGQAIYYRIAKPPERTKYNAEAIKDFEKKKAFYRLKQRKMNMEDMNTAATSVFPRGR
jgi:hypothetical protein